MIKHNSPILFTCLLLLFGCSAMEQATPVSPSAIGVFNNTGRHIQKISFHTVLAKGETSTRVGMITPLPNGVTQLLGRGSHPRALPKQGVLTWVDEQGNEHSQLVGKSSLTNQATATPGEILLIEVLPSSRITIRYVLGLH